MIVRENIEFKRGQDTKRSLNIGYIKRMPEIAEELKKELNYVSDYNWDVELANHPESESGMTSLIFDNPCYVIDGGFEEGHGLPEGSDIFLAHYSIHWDPIDMKIWAQFTILDQEEEERKIKYPEEWIPNSDLIDIKYKCHEIVDYFLEKAEIELE